MSQLPQLNQFTGTEHYHKLSMFGNFKCTDGVKYVADTAGAYWLIDAIASYQPKLKSIEFQSWKLQPNKTTDGATLTCTDGNKKKLASQKFSYSSVNEEVALFLTDGVLMLASEY